MTMALLVSCYTTARGTLESYSKAHQAQMHWLWLPRQLFLSWSAGWHKQGSLEQRQRPHQILSEVLKTRAWQTFSHTLQRETEKKTEHWWEYGDEILLNEMVFIYLLSRWWHSGGCDKITYIMESDVNTEINWVERYKDRVKERQRDRSMTSGLSGIA